jgi:hypothetical protein
VKSIDLRLIVGGMPLFVIVLTGGTVRGQDFPQTSAAARSSVVHGFKQSSLPLLHRFASSDPAAVSTALVEKLCTTPCPHPRVRTPGNMLEVTNGDWSLQILGDGTSARFQDSAVGKRAHSLAEMDSDRTTASALEQAGRKFIASKLASVIILGPEEELVPVRTDYRIEGGYNVKTRETTRSVVANRIVFGRTTGGVPIVGGGSTVVLTFANDGSLESFQYDWPKYGATTVRAVVNVEEILRRVQKVVGMRTGVPIANPSARAPKDEGPTYAVELTKNTILRKLECGYYDPGFLVRTPNAAVQPGCVYHAVSQGEDGTRSGVAGAVPGAAQIEPDAAWPEAVVLRGPSPNEKPIVPGSSRSQ